MEDHLLLFYTHLNVYSNENCSLMIDMPEIKLIMWVKNLNKGKMGPFSVPFFPERD